MNEALKKERFDFASELLDEVVEFLVDCGGPYEHTTPHMETLLLYSITTNQCFISRDNLGNIRWVVCWLRIDHKDMDGMMTEDDDERVFPYDMTKGDNIYVHNAATRADNGVNEMRRAVFALPHRGMFWHRRVRGLKYYPNHRGGLYG